MRHYEIVFLVHPDQSDQTQSILDKFSSIVEGSGGKVHRLENIGSKKLSYPIQDQFKASYGLLNIECNKEALEEIKNFFNFNDSIIRELVLSVNKAYKEVSALSSQTDQEEEDPFSDSTDLKAVFAEKYPGHAEEVKSFRRAHGAKKVGEITVDMVREDLFLHT